MTDLDDRLLPTLATDGKAQILYTLAEATQVRIMVYDVTGRLTRCLVEQAQPAGRHSVQWDGRDDDGRSVSAGVYFAHLNLNGSDIDSEKIVMVK
jgi:flagellar hook assembly protein FlgD